MPNAKEASPSLTHLCLRRARGMSVHARASAAAPAASLASAASSLGPVIGDEASGKGWAADAEVKEPLKQGKLQGTCVSLFGDTSGTTGIRSHRCACIRRVSKCIGFRVGWEWRNGAPEG